MNNIKCQDCGWCCSAIPCPISIYLTSKYVGKCKYLEYSNGKSNCSLISFENDPIKKAALEELLISGKGCTHKLGPHPRTLLDITISNGLVIASPEWKQIINQMQETILKMTNETNKTFHKNQLTNA